MCDDDVYLCNKTCINDQSFVVNNLIQNVKPIMTATYIIHRILK